MADRQTDRQCTTSKCSVVVWCPRQASSMESCCPVDMTINGDSYLNAWSLLSEGQKCAEKIVELNSSPMSAPREDVTTGLSGVSLVVRLSSCSPASRGLSNDDLGRGRTFACTASEHPFLYLYPGVGKGGGIEERRPRRLNDRKES